MAGKRPGGWFWVGVAVVHGTVVTLTWRDLGRRPVELVRGRKGVWRVVSALNTTGGLAYWLFGRRRG